MAREQDLLGEAQRALDESDWTSAASAFRAALDHDRSPEALDGLAQALWWLGEVPEAIRLRRDAYARFRRRGEANRAARIALWLAGEQDAAGNTESARGWLARAGSLIAPHPRGIEHGWLALACTKRGGDTESMSRDASEALTIARTSGDPDLEIRALARLGLALVLSGDVEAGLEPFNEAMTAVTAGEARSPDTVGEAFCDLLLAVELTADGRFDAWTVALAEWMGKHDHPPVIGFCGACCSELFAMAGHMTGAELELKKALDKLGAADRGRCVHPAAKLAELRVIQGRFEEAERLLDGFEGLPESVRPRVALAMARGQHAVASALLERRLNTLGTDTLLSVPLLVQLVEVRLAKEDPEGAKSAAGRLAALASTSGLARLEAYAERAFGRIAAAVGEPVARTHIERALELFTKLSMPLDESRTRLLLAETIVVDEPELAASEAREAAAIFGRLGATREADAAAALARRITGEGRAGPRRNGTLTKREHEVLALIAAGLTNAEIAGRLYISSKTAEHHVSNILQKLGLRSRAEAAAYAIRTT